MRQKRSADTTSDNGSRHEPAEGFLANLTRGRVLFLIIALTVIVYANSLGGEFLYDDPKQIINNPALRSWSNVVDAFTSDVWSFQRGSTNADIALPYYRPLFTVYFTIAYQLFGLWEPGWHLLNLLVHVLATIAVFRLAERLSSSLVVAGLTGLFFGIHPVHVESVSWISGIPDPLAALFYVTAFWCYLRSREESSPNWLAFSLALFGLSLLCKETPIVLPAVIAVWELSLTEHGAIVRRLKASLKATLPFIAVALAYLAIRFMVLESVGWKHPMMAQVSDTAVGLTMPYVLVSYLRHLVIPFNLSLLYGSSLILTTSDVRFGLAVLVLIALAVILWFYRRRVSSQIATALALLLFPLLPVLNLRVFHEEYLIQDRYLYLPSIGFCFFLALLIDGLARKKRALAFALTAIIVVGFAVGTALQNRVWNNGVALWSRALKHSPSSWSAHYNLGLAYAKEGKHREARDAFVEALRFNAGVAAIYNSLALAQDRLGDEGAAISNLQRALVLDPSMHEARNNLGTVQFRKGDVTAATEQFELALGRDPGNESVQFNLARARSARGDHQGAIPIFERLLANRPNDTEVRYHLALSYAANGRAKDAIAQLQRALADERVPERANEIRLALERLTMTTN